MKRILLTGFDPFGSEPGNASWEVARSLDGLLIGENHQIVSARLPCEFVSSLHLLEAALRQHHPAIVICLGQAGGRPDISLERIAINIDDARIPDNAGAQPVDIPVVEGGPAAYFSSLPIKAIVQEMRLAGIPASVSQTAGTFVCNHVFYGLMHMAATADYLFRAGFIHVPYTPEQAVSHTATASMSLDMLKTAILKALESILKTDRDLRISGGVTH